MLEIHVLPKSTQLVHDLSGNKEWLVLYEPYKNYPSMWRKCHFIMNKDSITRPFTYLDAEVIGRYLRFTDTGKIEIWDMMNDFDLTCELTHPTKETPYFTLKCNANDNVLFKEKTLEDLIAESLKFFIGSANQGIQAADYSSNLCYGTNPVRNQHYGRWDSEYHPKQTPNTRVLTLKNSAAHANALKLLKRGANYTPQYIPIYVAVKRDKPEHIQAVLGYYLEKEGTAKYIIVFDANYEDAPTIEDLLSNEFELHCYALNYTARSGDTEAYALSLGDEVPIPDNIVYSWDDVFKLQVAR